MSSRIRLVRLSWSSLRSIFSHDSGLGRGREQDSLPPSDLANMSLKKEADLTAPLPQKARQEVGFGESLKAVSNNNAKHFCDKHLIGSTFRTRFHLVLPTTMQKCLLLPHSTEEENRGSCVKVAIVVIFKSKYAQIPHHAVQELFHHALFFLRAPTLFQTY